MNFKNAVDKVMADPRYKKNIEFGEPRSGHPEGKIKFHIADLEANLERLKHRLRNDEDYWKLKFLIHVHDTFKAESLEEGVIATNPRSHESLARAFASEFTDDIDLLNMIQYHDESFALWRQFRETGGYDDQRFQVLLNTIRDWELFLTFTIVDGSTEGKDLEKLPWFINEVRRYKQTQVTESWVLK